MIDQVYQAPNVQSAIAPQQNIKSKSFREYPLLVGLVYWWLQEAPLKIFSSAKKIIFYCYKYFSISILFKTLFDPWKKDEIDTTNMALDDIIKVKMMNLVSRFVGLAVRSMTIGIGLSAIVSITVISILFLIGFILLPAIAIYLIINGLVLLNGSI